MATLPSSLYRVLLWIGAGALFAGMALGVYQSWRTDEALPSISLSALASSHEEIEALMLAERWDEAIERLRIIRELVIDDREITENLLGEAYQGTGDSAAAIEHFRQSLRIAADYSEARNNLAIALAQSGRVGDAVEEFLTVLRIDPSFDYARQNLQVAAARLERELLVSPEDSRGQALLVEARQVLSQGPIGASPPSPGPSTPEESLILGRCHEHVAQFYEERFGPLTQAFAPELAQRMDEARLAALRTGMVDQLGNEFEIVRDDIEMQNDRAVCTRWARFDRYEGFVELVIVIRTDMTIEDFRIRVGEASEDSSGGEPSG